MYYLNYGGYTPNIVDWTSIAPMVSQMTSLTTFNIYGELGKLEDSDMTGIGSVLT